MIIDYDSMSIFIFNQERKSYRSLCTVTAAQQANNKTIETRLQVSKSPSLELEPLIALNPQSQSQVKSFHTKLSSFLSLLNASRQETHYFRQNKRPPRLRRCLPVCSSSEVAGPTSSDSALGAYPTPPGRTWCFGVRARSCAQCTSFCRDNRAFCVSCSFSGLEFDCVSVKLWLVAISQ
jgi:hypothetical protein